MLYEVITRGTVGLNRSGGRLGKATAPHFVRFLLSSHAEPMLLGGAALARRVLGDFEVVLADALV